MSGISGGRSNEQHARGQNFQRFDLREEWVQEELKMASLTHGNRLIEFKKPEVIRSKHIVLY